MQDVSYVLFGPDDCGLLPVVVWCRLAYDMQVYCCETCQPLRLPAVTVVQPSDAAAAAGAKPGRKGRSRSAPAGALDAAAAAAAATAAGSGQDPAAVAAQLLHPSRLKSMAAAKVAQVGQH